MIRPLFTTMTVVLNESHCVPVYIRKSRLAPKNHYFAEIHCEGPGHSVEIVYANTPEGESKVEMINKKVAGCIKENDLLKPIWGRWVHITKPVNYDS